MLPNYEFYTDVYYGDQIAESDFPRLLARASAFLNNNCYNISVVPEEAYNNAVCAVAEAWQVNEQGGDVVSQSVGSWSRTLAEQKPKSNDQRLLEAAELYLKKYCSLSVRWV